MADPFQVKKARNAELITPSNTLKKKAGSGGFEKEIMEKAQALIDNNTTDFSPTCYALIDDMHDALQRAQSGAVAGEKAIEAIITPTMQLKAQGAMFRYPLITEVAGTLVSFLETVTEINKDTIDVINAHKTSLRYIIASKIQDSGGAKGKELKDALYGACTRYFKLYHVA